LAAQLSGRSGLTIVVFPLILPMKDQAVKEKYGPEGTFENSFSVAYLAKP
jgi:hypothetical protein